MDGIYSGLRREEVKLCSLVVTDVNDQGEKKFLTIEDGGGLVSLRRAGARCCWI